MKNDVAGYESFRTDFSYYDKTLFRDDDGYVVNISNWDIYHLQLGINVKKKRFNFRAGLLLNYAGTSHYDQPINFDDPKESDFLRGTLGFASATRLGSGVLMSYVYNL